MKPNALMLLVIGAELAVSAAPRPSPLGWHTKAAGLVELSGNASSSSIRDEPVKILERRAE
jgi:hypothetical protein